MFLNNNKTSGIIIDAPVLKQFDGFNKSVDLPNVSYKLVEDKSKMTDFDKAVIRYLCSEGDANIITTYVADTPIKGVFSSTLSLKQSAKQMLRDLFGIRNSSALNNQRGCNTVISLPLLINGKQSMLLGAQYSYIMANPDLFPKMDLIVIDPKQLVVDDVIATLSQKESAIVFEDFQNPEEDEITIYDNFDKCFASFHEICDNLEKGNNSFERSRIEYPNLKELPVKHKTDRMINRGNTVIVLIDEKPTVRYTMYNPKYY